MPGKASTARSSTRYSSPRRSGGKDDSSSTPGASCAPTPARPPPRSTTTTTPPPAYSPQHWPGAPPDTTASASPTPGAPRRYQAPVSREQSERCSGACTGAIGQHEREEQCGRDQLGTPTSSRRVIAGPPCAAWKKDANPSCCLASAVLDAAAQVAGPSAPAMAMASPARTSRASSPAV